VVSELLLQVPLHSAQRRSSHLVRPGVGMARLGQDDLAVTSLFEPSLLESTRADWGRRDNCRSEEDRAMFLYLATAAHSNPGVVPFPPGSRCSAAP
jgi:hypothetical protein